MGHEVLVINGRSAVMHDADLWLLRHFALEQLAIAGDADAPLRDYFSSWEWHAPGVYLNLRLSTTPDASWLASLQALVLRMRARIGGFGAAVPVDYLRSQVRGGLVEWRGDISTDIILRALADFEGVAFGVIPDGAERP